MICIPHVKSIPNWKRELELKSYSKHPNVYYKKLVNKLSTTKSFKISDKLIQEKIETFNKSKIKDKSIKDRPFAAKISRFDMVPQSDTPGCGTYGIGGIPYTIKEKSERDRNYFKGVFNKAIRMSVSKDANPGPGTYETVSFMDKTNLKRGAHLSSPFFLSHRLKNPHILNLGPGSYNIKSSIDNLNDSNNYYKGRFGKTEQYPEKPNDRIFWTSVSNMPANKNNQVSPASYSIKNTNIHCSFNRKNNSFHTLAPRNTDLQIGWKSTVGPGRFSIQRTDEMRYVPSHKSVFVSATPARLSGKFEPLMRERIRVSGRQRFQQPPRRLLF